MQSRLFSLLDIAFPSYFVLLLTGFVLATVLGSLWAKRIGRDPDVIVDLGLTALIAGVFGARILHVLADGYFWDYVHLCTDPAKVVWKITQAECLRADPPDMLLDWIGLGASGGAIGRWDATAGVCHPVVSDCWAWARFWAGGLTYYGGFIGASVAAWFVLKRDRFPFWKAADMAGMVIPLGLAFGRMGCVLAGCCFGKPWHSHFGLVFPSGSPASEAEFKLGLLPSSYLPSLPVHPTQLYEAAGSLAISAALLLWFHERKRYDGHVFVAFIVSYASLRVAIEFLRADDRGGLLGLSTSQLIGFVLIAVAWALHRYRRGTGIVPPRSENEALASAS